MAERSSTIALVAIRSSMKTCLIRPLITLELTGAYDLDHSTTPEVVSTSKESNILSDAYISGLVVCGKSELLQDSQVLSYVNWVTTRVNLAR